MKKGILIGGIAAVAGVAATICLGIEVTLTVKEIQDRKRREEAYKMNKERRERREAEKQESLNKEV